MPKVIRNGCPKLQNDMGSENITKSLVLGFGMGQTGSVYNNLPNGTRQCPLPHQE